MKEGLMAGRGKERKAEVNGRIDFHTPVIVDRFA